jgi:hypothetical protein
MLSQLLGRVKLMPGVCVVAATLAAGLSVVAMMTGRSLKHTVASTGELSLGYVTSGSP